MDRPTRLRMRASGALFLLLAGCASPTVQPSPTSAGVQPPAPDVGPPSSSPVVVAIVVDQLAAWVAAERWPLLPNGGFARLRREGTWVKNLRYLHAATETAPGHAALFTGSPPRETGIVGNQVWRKVEPHKPPGKASLLDDPTYVLVSSKSGVVKVVKKGGEDKPGVSLHKLKTETLADRLVHRPGGAVVVALSMKDRGAVFAGGRSPTAAIWIDDDEGGLVMSRPKSSQEALPSWVPWDEVRGDIDAGATWEWSDRAFLEQHAGASDRQTPDVCGSTHFPHTSICQGVTASCRSAFFRATPSSDALLVDLAVKAVSQARKPDQPMLLAISFSANDLIGHRYGPSSWEAWDELAQLDATLNRLLTELDRIVGKDGYAVVLSGDHGIVPFPEPLGGPKKAPWCAGGAEDPYERPCEPLKRFVPEEMSRVLNEDRKVKEFPSANPVAAVVGGLVFLTPEARGIVAAQPKKRASLGKSMLDALKPMGIKDVLAIADVGNCGTPSDNDRKASEENMNALVCRATVPVTSDDSLGDYYLVPKKGSFEAPGSSCYKPQAEVGVSHGTPYLYDRTVPLLVRYPQGPGGKEIDEPKWFGSYYASLWYALTGEEEERPYGGPIGVPPKTP